MVFQKALKAGDLPLGKLAGATVGGREILLANVDGQFYAMDAVCTHEGGPLPEGTLQGTTVTCPWHEGQYDVRTGEANPQTDWVRNTATFPTQVKDGFIWVDL